MTAQARLVLALANLKGGVGKTSTAVNLAAALGETGEKCLVVDLDSQGSASIYLGVKNEGQPLLDCLKNREGFNGIIKPTAAPNVDIVPGGYELADADRDLLGTIGADSRLKICLGRTTGPWKWVFLDCPPGLGVLVVNAMVAASGVLVPTEGHPLALEGMSELANTIEDIRDGGLNPALQITGVIPCRCQVRRVTHREALEDLNEAFPGRISPIVRENAALVEAPGNRQPVTVYAPKSNGAIDYRAVAGWLRKQVNA